MDKHNIMTQHVIYRMMVLDLDLHPREKRNASLQLGQQSLVPLKDQGQIVVQDQGHIQDQGQGHEEDILREGGLIPGINIIFSSTRHTVMIQSFQTHTSYYSTYTNQTVEVWWPNGRVLDSGARVRGFDPHSGRPVVSLSKIVTSKKY